MSAGTPEAVLVNEVEDLLLTLRERLDERAKEVAGDVIAADELYVVAGQLDATLRMALEHVEALRTALEQGAAND
jgi:hypothetical protein